MQLGLENVLSAVTIVVLVFTWKAVIKQASVAQAQTDWAKKLAELTEKQMEAAEKQAAAAAQQVDIARGQITESLRPILMLRCKLGPPINTPTGVVIDIIVKNEGAGTALDVWWTYGDVANIGSNWPTRNRVEQGIIPPGKERNLRTHRSRAFREGVLVGYESLSGVISGTRLYWTGQDWSEKYYPDVSDWAPSLAGNPLVPSRDNRVP